MNHIISDLLKRLNDPIIDSLEIIKWASPIPAFGNPLQSKIATLGINPSDKEFVDHNGKELIQNSRRFHTLNSLGISNWNEIDTHQIQSIIEYCNDYFVRKPYDNWFKRLDYLISGSSISYYFPSREACHLDLVPYATTIKWGTLSTTQKNQLLQNYGDILGEIIKQSTISVLVLNGKTVIDNLLKISDVDYLVTEQSKWDLSRATTKNVKGYSYEGFLTKIGGLDLDKKIFILGFNHNIQSSFGVTSAVQQEMRHWISDKLKEYT